MSEEDNQVHLPPTRDAAALKNVLYGPGHEKYPSWPIAAAAEAPIATRAPPTGTSQRSKSWTDHTNYPKESVVAYTRPYMRRTHPHQLKTVLERCEKSTQEQINYLTRMERIEKHAEKENVPSPPVRDSTHHKKLQDYEKLLEDQSLLRYSYDMLSKENTSSLTQADLEEYTRTCDEINIQHQKQPSYAQSEGYHSYVSSTDSTSTPFLDRLRRDIDTNTLRGSSNSWDHDSIVTTSSGSASSSETLKWRGSLSDVSVASSSFNVGRQQLIAHSARVQTPQRHNSESVLYIENNRNDYPSNLARSHYASSNCSGTQLAEPQSNNVLNHSPPSPQRTVAERIHQYEKQATKYTYLGPDKKTKVPDPALKAIQKEALLQFYERHQQQSKSLRRSEAKLNSKHNQPNPTEDITSDNVNSQIILKHKSHGESESSVQNKSLRLPGLVDFKSQSNQLPISCNKPEQQNSMKIKREMSPVVRDQMDPRNLQLNNYAFKTTQIPNDTIKKVASNPIINYDDPMRRIPIKNNVVSSREFNNHERSPSADLKQYTTPKILSDPPLTSETQNSDLQGPIIIGNSISVDDWVPERPPKNQELLRSVYPDLYKDKSRYHSPELPLPSPPLPLCDDETVHVSDEPFPPPPLEIIDEWKYQQEVLDMPPPRDLMKSYNRNSMPESQKPGKYAVKDTSILEEINACKANNVLSKSPAPLTKPKPLKREYPSQSKVNIASRRNSFANAQDISKDYPVLAANMRASVREKPNQFSSSKLVMSAQRQLYSRSITVDQSPLIPKKPINPFLRSTSMRHDVEHNKDVISHNTINLEKSPLRPDGPNIQYHHHYNQRHSANGLPILQTNEKLAKVSGHFRAEPLWLTPPENKHDGRKENILIHDIPWRPAIETRRISLPCKPTEVRSPIPRHDYLRNASFDGTEVNKISYSFCETDVEKVTAKTADVRSTNLENIVKKPSLHWSNSSTPLKAIHQPENMRRHSTNSGLHTEHEKGSPDVNIGSYKKINVSLEKQYISSEPKDTVSESKSTLIVNNTLNLKDVKEIVKDIVKKEEIVEKSVNNNNTVKEEKEIVVENKKSQNNEENLPDILITKDVCDTDVIKEQKNTSIITETSSLSDEENVTKTPPLNSSRTAPKLERLKPRILLPEENVWETLRCNLTAFIQPEAPSVNLISQYDEYNSTIESITNIFELDVAENPEPATENAEENEPEKESSHRNQESVEKKKDVQVVGEREQNQKIDCVINKDDNWDNVKSNASACLNNLVAALIAEEKEFEKARSVNEAVGVQLLATASKSARLSRHAADVGSVTALIAGLATRLGRATRPLKLAVHTPERKKILMAKQEKLADQLEEAKRLKESIDERGLTLSDTLLTQVSDAFREQYSKFIATKVKLVVYSKDVHNRLDLAKQLLDSLTLENGFINSSSATRNEIV